MGFVQLDHKSYTDPEGVSDTKDAVFSNVS